MKTLLQQLLVIYLFSLILSGCSEHAAEQNERSRLPFLSSTADVTLEPGYPISFPLDHGSHAPYPIEWWYLTATLQNSHDPQQLFAVQWTLFRFNRDQTNQSQWDNGQLYMSHARIVSEDNHYFAERFAHGGVGNAGASISPVSFYLDDWALSSQHNDLNKLNLQARINDTTHISLQLNSDFQPVLHGQHGYSVKADNTELASYYYSQLYQRVEGNLVLDGKTVSVAGKAWFDHEWSASLLNDAYLGWDWFSMQFAQGDALMLFRLRHQDNPGLFRGSYIDKNGKLKVLNEGDIKVTETANANVHSRNLPLGWHIEVPALDIALQAAPFKQDQWVPGVVSYYEGMILIKGNRQGKGFVELVGY